MATNVKPPKKRKGAPSEADQPLKNNLEKPAAHELIGLHFKIPPEFRQQYNIYAAEKNMFLVDVLKQSFDFHR